jgi:hypothetical protein
MRPGRKLENNSEMYLTETGYEGTGASIVAEQKPVEALHRDL